MRGFKLVVVAIKHFQKEEDDDFSTNKEEEIMDTWIGDEDSTRKDKMIADYIDYRNQEWYPTDMELMILENEVTPEDLEVYEMNKNDLYDTASYFEEIEKSKTKTGIETRLEITLINVGLLKYLNKTPFNKLIDEIQRIKEVANKDKTVKVSYPFILSKLIDDEDDVIKIKPFIPKCKKSQKRLDAIWENYRKSNV